MKKINKKVLRQKENVTVVIDFVDGRRLNLKTNKKALPQLQDQLIHRNGQVNVGDQIFNFHDMVHFEVVE